MSKDLVLMCVQRVVSKVVWLEHVVKDMYLTLQDKKEHKCSFLKNKSTLTKYISSPKIIKITAIILAPSWLLPTMHFLHCFPR